MTPRSDSSQVHPEQGQVLPLFVLMLIVLLGLAALAVDVSGALALRRFERSAADGAALAGAQDLQTVSTRQVTAPQRTDARRHALQILTSLLRASSAPTCNPASDIVDCVLPGTPYLVSIKTPSPVGETVDMYHAVQVKVRNPSWQTSFAGLYGQKTWDIASTSVAGTSFSSKYAVMTLQPPAPKNNGTDANLCSDLVVNAQNTVLNVISGDIGTNTSATTTNQGLIVLNNGDYTSNTYYIDHIDDITNASCGTNINPTWSVDAAGNPPGRQISSLILDPGYPAASFPTSGLTKASSFSTAAAGAISCTDPSVGFPTDALTVTYLTPASGGTLTCYKPGIYTGSFVVSNKDVAYLAPGAYSFTAGITVDSILAGGLVDGQRGVTLQLPESNTQLFVANNNSAQIVLNMGSRSCVDNPCRAKPALDVTGAEIRTPEGLAVTVAIVPDSKCFANLTPVNSGGCSINQNKTVKLTSALLVQIAGVLYGPSDNMTITGGSNQQGYVGQIVSWTVFYTGGSTLNQAYPGSLGLGVLRLDSACTLTSC